MRVALACLQMALPAEAPGKPDPRIAKSGNYRFDPAHSQVLFTVTHLGWTYYTGQFRRPSGRLTLDTKHPSLSKISVTFPIDSVQTTVPELDTHLKSADFFDAAKFPTVTFVSTAVTPTSATTATIVGTLSLHGVTRPVTLQARFIGAGKQFWGGKKMALGFAATGSVKRSAFGMASSLGLVSDDVELVINAGFEAE